MELLKELLSTIHGIFSDPEIDSWNDSFYSQFISQMMPLVPDHNQVSSPSNDTMNSLAMRIASMSSVFERHLTEKSSKKNKFDNLSESKKCMILNASSLSSIDPAPALTEELKQIIFFLNISIARDEMKLMLHQRRCNIYVPISVATASMSGDWIVQGYTDPGKLSLLLLGKSMHYSNCAAEIKRLKLHLQQLAGKGWDDETVNKLCTFTFSCTETLPTLQKQLETLYHFLGLILGYKALFTVQVKDLYLQS